MRRLLAALGIIVLALVIVVAAAVTFPGLWLTSIVEDRLQARLDREVSIDGGLDLHLFDPPALIAYRVTVANPDWAEEPALLEAQRVRVTFDADALLNFSVKPESLSLIEPDLYLARAGEDRTTWPSGDNGAMNLGLGRLEVTDGRFEYRVPERDTAMTGTLETTDGGDGVTYSASGTYKGRETEASGTGGDPLVLLRGEEPWPLDAEITAGGHEVALDGTATGLPAPSAVDMQIAGAGPSLAGLGALVNAGLPTSPAYDLSGRLILEGSTHWRFEEAGGTIGDSDVAGRIGVQTAQDQSLLTAELSSQTLHATDVRAVLGEPGAQQTGGPTEIPSEGLRTLNADVSASAEALMVAGRSLEEVTVTVDLQDGRLHLEPLRFGVGDGRASGSATLAAGQGESAPSAAVALDLNRLELQPLAGVEAVRGVFGGRIDVQSTGQTLQAMRGNVDGQVVLLMSDGRLTRDWLSMAAFGLEDLFVAQDEPGTDIRCMAVGAEIAQGIAEAGTLYADTNAALVRGDGSVNLRDLTLDLAFRIEPRGDHLFEYNGPVGVSGPVSDPSIDLDVGEAVAEGLATVALKTVLAPVTAATSFMDETVGSGSSCRARLDAAG